jgi:hypothetical protein
MGGGNSHLGGSPPTSQTPPLSSGGGGGGGGDNNGGGGRDSRGGGPLSPSQGNDGSPQPRSSFPVSSRGDYSLSHLHSSSQGSGQVHYVLY